MNNGIKPKQAGILLTLLVGIICVGLLAHRVNTQLVENGQYTAAVKETDKEQEKNGATDKKKGEEASNDYFYELKSTKEQEIKRQFKL